MCNDRECACYDGEAYDEIDTLNDELDRLRAENEQLTEWKQDWIDTYRKVVSGFCAGDEKHCSCVPILREEIERLRAELLAAERNGMLRAAEMIRRATMETVDSNKEYARLFTPLLSGLTKAVEEAANKLGGSDHD